jgi:hypothetical protein
MVKNQSHAIPSHIQGKDQSELDTHKVARSSSIMIAKSRHDIDSPSNSPQSSPEIFCFVECCPEIDSQDDHSDDDDTYSRSDLDDLEIAFSFNSNYSTEYESADPKPPFWFGLEDPDQIRQLMHAYDQQSRLESERKSCVRAPKPFVGRVMRVQVRNSEFCTLDRVDIYHLDPVPLWCPLKCSRSLTFLTTWDAEKGEPVSISPITTSKQLHIWKGRQNRNIVSYLYCQPVYQRKCEFRYWVDREKHEVCYSNAPFTYSKFIPETVFQKQFNGTLICDAEGDNFLL